MSPRVTTMAHRYQSHAGITCMIQTLKQTLTLIKRFLDIFFSLMISAGVTKTVGDVVINIAQSLT